MYEASTQQVRNSRLAKIKQIDQSMLDIDREQSGLTRNVGRVEVEVEKAKKENDAVTVEIKEKRLQLLEQEIETLERERRRLLQAKVTLEEEIDDDIGSLDEELIKLKNGWADYSFKKRRSLLNFATVEVKINKVSTHWIEIVRQHLDLARRSPQRNGLLDLSDSYADMQFKKEKDIPEKVSYTTWEELH